MYFQITSSSLLLMLNQAKSYEQRLIKSQVLMCLIVFEMCNKYIWKYNSEYFLNCFQCFKVIKLQELILDLN